VYVCACGVAWIATICHCFCSTVRVSFQQASHVWSSTALAYKQVVWAFGCVGPSLCFGLCTWQNCLVLHCLHYDLSAACHTALSCPVLAVTFQLRASKLLMRGKFGRTEASPGMQDCMC
jgi:hypothetical protein